MLVWSNNIHPAKIASQNQETAPRGLYEEKKGTKYKEREDIQFRYPISEVICELRNLIGDNKLALRDKTLAFSTMLPQVLVSIKQYELNFC